MPPSPARFLSLAPVLACAFACAHPEPTRELHQWSDAEGNVVYTAHPERIPVVRQSSHRVVEPGRSARQNAAPPPAEPAAEAAPPRPEATTPPPVSAEPARTLEPAPGLEEEPAPPPPADLDARIAALEERIAADEEVLKALISDPAKAGELRGSPEVRAIGERLPVLQAELASLRAQRADRDAGDAGDAGDDG